MITLLESHVCMASCLCLLTSFNAVMSNCELLTGQYDTTIGLTTEWMITMLCDADNSTLIWNGESLEQ